MKLGCQSRSFGKGIYPDETDFLEVVRQIGGVGFLGLEANWKNLERYFEKPETFKEILEASNLQLVGAHYGAAHWDESARDQIQLEGACIADFVAAVGGEFIVCSGRRPTKGTVSQELWEKTGEGLNLFGEACAPKGIRLAYHNHWWEPEQDGFAKLAACTNPSTVGFAFDTGHHIRAGKDPASLVNNLHDRMSIIHLCDCAEDGDGNLFRPQLGQGTLDMPNLRKSLEGFSGWLVLEEENSAEPAAPVVAECIQVMHRFVEAKV